MSVTNELLGNQAFINSTLKSLIELECKRVVDAGLVSKADCFAFIEKYKNSTDNQKSLLTIYNSLTNIKLAGDKLDEESFYDITDILNKLKEIKKDAPVKESSCPCEPGQCVESDKCTCSNECECKNDNKLLIKLQQLDSLISNKLEKIAYALGSSGDHETAYLVERTLKNIRCKLKMVE